MNLLELPNELLFKIAEQINDPQSSLNFLMVCKKISCICQQVVTRQKKLFVKDMYISTCCFVYHPFFLEVNPYNVYKALPNGEFVKTPKFELKPCPEGNLDPERRISFQTQINFLFRHSQYADDTPEKIAVNNFLRMYFIQISPVELLWVIWKDFRRQYKSLESAEDKIVVSKAFVGCILNWIGVNFNTEWKRREGKKVHLFSPSRKNPQHNEIYQFNLLPQEMIRFNRKLENLFAEGAAEIEKALIDLESNFENNTIPQMGEKVEINRRKTLLDFSSEQIVMEITAFHYFVIRNIHPSEFFEEAREYRPNWRLLFEQFNLLTSKLVNVVLECETMELRALIISKLTDCASFALNGDKFVNYFFAKIIYSVTQTGAVHRLVHTWELLRHLFPSYLNQVNSLNELLGNERNFATLRNHIRDQEKPYIHQLALLNSNM